MKKNFYRVIFSTLRTILGIGLFKIAAMLTDTAAICNYLAEHGIESDLTPILVWMSSFLTSGILSVLSIFLISPLAVLLVMGLLQQSCGLNYQHTKKLFHQMREFFIW